MYFVFSFGWMLSRALVMRFVVELQESVLCERWDALENEIRGSEVQERYVEE